MASILAKRLVARIGYGTHVKLFLDNKKGELIELPEPVVKVAQGDKHFAFITASGGLLTMGRNSDGQLGNKSKTDSSQPVKVEMFNGKSIKVKDVACGKRHTFVLDTQGRLYSFGYGGRKTNFIVRIFVSHIGPLGHGNNDSLIQPRQIKPFSDKRIVKISAGRDYCLALTEDGKLYNWGCGEYGVFGNGSNKNHSTPIQNDYFAYLAEEEKITIQEFQSVERTSLAKMSNGKIYGWGVNDAGQVGLKLDIGVQMSETINYASLIPQEGFENNTIVDYVLGQTASILKLDSGDHWWVGMRMAYKPQKLPLPAGTVSRLIGAGDRSLAVVSQDGKIYMSRSYFPIKKAPDLVTNLIVADEAEFFDNKKIVQMGSNHASSFALLV